MVKSIIISPRDFITVALCFEMSDGSVYIGCKSIEHPQHPLKPKVIRVDSRMASQILKPSADGKSTVLDAINEFNFGGNIPKIVGEKAAIAGFIDSLNDLLDNSALPCSTGLQLVLADQ